MTSHILRPRAFGCCVFALVLIFETLSFAAEPQSRPAVSASDIQRFLDTSQLEQLYLSLHKAPELSLAESKTAKRLADELRSAGYAVTENVGGHGVVGVLANGPGQVLLIRTDLDALPVKEQTGAEYASI